jgi:hypothetical protein
MEMLGYMFRPPHGHSHAVQGRKPPFYVTPFSVILCYSYGEYSYFPYLNQKLPEGAETCRSLYLI